MQLYRVRALDDIPEDLLTPGNRFAVPRADGLFDVYEYAEGDGGEGLGFISALIQVGVMAAGMIAGARSASRQEREINNAFDAKARAANQVFYPPGKTAEQLTRADLLKMQAAFEELAQLAAQYPTRGITEWWNSPAYKASYERRLAEVSAAVAANESRAVAAGASPADLPAGQQQQQQGGFPSWALLLVLVVLVLLRRD